MSIVRHSEIRIQRALQHLASVMGRGVSYMPRFLEDGRKVYDIDGVPRTAEQILHWAEHAIPPEPLTDASEQSSDSQAARPSPCIVCRRLWKEYAQLITRRIELMEAHGATIAAREAEKLLQLEADIAESTAIQNALRLAIIKHEKTVHGVTAPL